MPSRPLCARNHCSSLLSSHCALEITAQACSVATVRSKSLLELAQRPLCAQNHCSSSLSRPLCVRNHCSNLLSSHCENTDQACSVAIVRSKSLLELAQWPLCARNHCSSSLSRPLCARNHCSSMLIFSSEALRCFDPSIRIACAQFGLPHLTFGGTALLRPVLCTTPQAPYANLV